VLPLANRIAAALTTWLATPHGLTLRPDLDQVEALSPEREALWTRLDAATFLTANEKRAAAGYDPLPDGGDGLSAKAGFNPGQPRVPSGSGRPSGQWGDGGGDSADLQLASGRPTSLLDEEARGGHTIKRHVGKSDIHLLDRVRTEKIRAGIFTIGLKRAGTFPSVEAAEKLVNLSISRNQDAVDRILSGTSQQEYIEEMFPSPTGREAYRKSDQSQPYMRDTYGVALWLGRDPSSPNGYIVRTAYPMNPD
jgi:Bacterial CdiA-CT RNAse A domain